MSLRSFILGSIAIAATSASAWAVPVINIGQIDLLPNTPNQVRSILVSGGDPVQGLDFFSQVADGGPGEITGGVIDGPDISNVNIIAPGTIFGPNNTGQGGAGASIAPQYNEATTTTAAGTVAASGVIAFITFDTTGLTSGTFDFLLAGTLTGDTNFAGVPIDITNGTLVITSAPIPEPASLGLLGLAGLAVLRRRRA